MIIVVALGGNAISRKNEKGNITDQIRNSQKTAKHIVDLVEAGHKVVMTHGNGPQVGNVLRRVEASRDSIIWFLEGKKWVGERTTFLMPLSTSTS